MRNIITNPKLKSYVWAIILFMLGLAGFLCLGFMVRFLMSLLYPS